MKIGFTGTQRGMTKFQRECLKNFLDIYVGWNEELRLLQGDCIGADGQAAHLARSMGYKI